MDIRGHHIRYALMRTAWMLALVAVLVLLTVLERRTLEDFLWGLAPLTILWAALFAYALWRTQKQR